MDPHSILLRALESNLGTVADPGVSGLIRLGVRLLSVVELKAGANGFREVMDPGTAGQILIIGTSGAPSSSVAPRFGSVTGSSTGLTANGATYNSNSTPTALAAITFNAANEWTVLVSVPSGTSFKWLVLANFGGALA